MVTGCALSVRMLILPKEKNVINVKAKGLKMLSISIRKVEGLSINMEIGIAKSVISLTLLIGILAKTVGSTKIDLFYIYILLYCIYYIKHLNIIILLVLFILYYCY